jgi:hypothetical protein
MDFDEIPLSKADYQDRQRKKSKLQEETIKNSKKVHEVNSSDSDGLVNDEQDEVIFQGNKVDTFPSKYRDKAPTREKIDDARESSSLSDTSSVFGGDNSQRDKSSDINKLNFGYLSRFFQRVAERKGKQKSE